MKIEYDKDADALYIEFSSSVARTDRISDDLAVDYDGSGNVAGIEVLSASEKLLSDRFPPAITLQNLTVESGPRQPHRRDPQL